MARCPRCGRRYASEDYVKRHLRHNCQKARAALDAAAQHLPARLAEEAAALAEAEFARKVSKNRLLPVYHSVRSVG